MNRFRYPTTSVRIFPKYFCHENLDMNVTAKLWPNAVSLQVFLQLDSAAHTLTFSNFINSMFVQPITSNRKSPGNDLRDVAVDAEGSTAVQNTYIVNSGGVDITAACKHSAIPLVESDKSGSAHDLNMPSAPIHETDFCNMVELLGACRKILDDKGYTRNVLICAPDSLFLTPGTWDDLKEIVGSAAVFKLLTTCIVFQTSSYHKNSFVQLAGPPPFIRCARKEQSQRHAFCMSTVFYTRTPFLCLRKAFSLHAAWLVVKSKSESSDDSVMKLRNQIFYPDVPPKRSGTLSDCLLNFTTESIHRHARVPYKALLDRICPENTRQALAIKQYIGEADGCTLGIGNTTKEDSWQPNLADESFVSHGRVSAFLVAVLNRFFCNLCSRPVRCAFRHRITTIVGMRRREKLLHERLITGIPSIDVWKAIAPGTRASCNPQEAKLRTLYVQRWITWLFTEYVPCVIKSFFYVTERGKNSQRPEYIRHDTWSRMLNASYAATLHTQAINQNSQLNALNRHNAAFALPVDSTLYSVRCLPKDGTRMRLIMRRVRGGPSVRMLKIVQSILLYCTKTLPGALGASVSSVDEASGRLRNYAAACQRQLSMCSVDVRNCFDTVPHALLIQAVADLLTAATANCTALHVHAQRKYTVCADGSIISRSIYLASGYNGIIDTQNCKDLLTTWPNSATHAVPIAGGKTEFNNNQVLKILHDHVTKAYVKYANGNVHRLETGVPQGSVLSSLLCAILYGAMDQDPKHYSKLLNNALLMRYVDDMLFVSPDPDCVLQFARLMAAGIPEYGVSVNVGKMSVYVPHTGLCTRSNLSSLGLSVCDTGTINWCGLVIDATTLCFSSDSAKSLHEISDGTCVDALRPLGTIGAMLRRYVAPRLRPAVLQSVLSQPPSQILRPIARVLYEAAIHAALKLHVYLVMLRKRRVSYDHLLLVERPVKRSSSKTNDEPSDHADAAALDNDSTAGVNAPKCNNILATVDALAGYMKRTAVRFLGTDDRAANAKALITETSCVRTLVRRAFWRVWSLHPSHYGTHVRRLERRSADWTLWADADIASTGDATACIRWSRDN